MTTPTTTLPGRPQRLSALDSAFLHLEDPHTSLHIGSVAILDGDAPEQSAVLAAFERALVRVPRYRQRLRAVPLGLHRPVWVDYPGFDLSQHVLRRALPSPGGEAELADLVSALMSEPLDRHLPLWQEIVVEGLAGHRWALVTKVHHSMVDGVAGTDLLSRLFDHAAPIPRPRGAADGAAPWRPRPEPGPVQLTRDAVADRLSLPLRELNHLARSAASARRSLALAAGLGQGALTWAGAARPFQGSTLAGPIGRERVYRWSEVSLSEVATVREAFGGTINDVILTAVTLGLRDLLLARGEEPGAHTVRTLVPVSVRRPDERGHDDNRVSALLADLPVDIADAIACLRAVTVRTRHLKASHEAETGEAATELAELLPPPALAAALHVAFRLPHRVVTTVTTNVPGPRETLWFAGRELLATYPYVPIADRVRLGIAITSYRGRLLLGYTADAASTPDLDRLVEGVTAGFAALYREAALTW